MTKAAFKALGAGGWLIILGLCAILVASGWFAVYGWNLSNGAISTHGYIALSLGIILSMVVGGGLMALVFWSSRNGYDR